MPLKKGLPTEKYGGYNKTTAAFFMLVKYELEKKHDLMLMPVELLFADKVIADEHYAAEYAKQTIASILGKLVLSVDFPLGLRKIRIGTVFEFDGSFRGYITGKSGGGSKILLSCFSALIVGYEWERYIKRIERFAERKKDNPNMVYSERYDEVTKEKNVQLFDILVRKLQTPPYTKRPANPHKALVGGREKFEALDVFKQADCLLQILLIFSRWNSGCNLESVGGVAKAAVLTLSSCLSNWEKNYQDVRIVDMTASGLYQARSENLLALL